MSRSGTMSDLTGTDHSRVSRVAERLVAHGETIAISESSAGGLISAALLSVPGASAYFLGGGVIYTRKAMGALLELTPAKLEGLRSATEPMASLLAETVRSRLNADWGLAETGRPVPPAIDMETPQGMPAWPSRADGRPAEFWRRGRAIGCPTWWRSRTRRWNCWKKLCLVDEQEPTAKRTPKTAMRVPFGR